MTFDELKAINEEATRAAWKASNKKGCAEDIGKIRREALPSIGDMTTPFNCGYSSGRHMTDEAKEAVKQATLDLLPDILRLAEMRLEAEGRRLSALARAKQEQLRSYLGDEA